MKLLPILLSLVALPAAAQIRIPLQGSLSDGGTPVTGPVDLEVSVVDGGGVALTCESFIAVPLVNGTFHLMLGDTVNDCGAALPTELEATLFQGGPLEVRVSYDAADFTFPIGDVPSAGVAELCQSAQLLEGYTASDFLGHPRLLHAADDVALAAALALAETDATAATPFVIELGPDSYDGGITVPSFTRLRGQGPASSTIAGVVVVQGNAALRDLRIHSELPGMPALTLRPANGTPVELVGVRISATPTAQHAAGIFIEQGTLDSRVTLRDVAIDVAAPSGCIGVLDAVGVRLTVVDTRMDLSGDAGVCVGVRIGQAGEVVPDFVLEVSGLQVTMRMVSGFSAAIETNAGGGSARIVDADLRVIAPGGRAIGVQGGDVRVSASRLFADHPLFRLGGNLRVATSGLETFTGNFVEQTSESVHCLHSHDEAAFVSLNADCDVL